jgi:hypothetical protein
MLRREPGMQRPRNRIPRTCGTYNARLSSVRRVHGIDRPEERTERELCEECAGRARVVGAPRRTNRPSRGNRGRPRCTQRALCAAHFATRVCSTPRGAVGAVLARRGRTLVAANTRSLTARIHQRFEGAPAGTIWIGDCRRVGSRRHRCACGARRAPCLCTRISSAPGGAMYVVVARRCHALVAANARGLAARV